MPKVLYTKDGYPYYQNEEGLPLGNTPEDIILPPKLPVQNQYKPTTYIIEPDLMEATTKPNVPDDVGFDDAGFPYNKITGQPVQVIRRPNMLPIAPTPDGYTFAMPKMLDVVGNVMGNVGGLAGGKIAAKPGEVVLGSGMVSKMKEAVEPVLDTGPFFSTLERAVDNSKIGKADAQQWLGYLRNQPGVKSEELEYVLKDLPTGQVTRKELQDIIKNNKIELNEVWKGGKKPSLSEEEKLKLSKLEERFANKDMTLNTDDAADLAELRMRKEGYPDTNNPTKYSQYQLPGGENYQELILTLPVETSPKAKEAFDLTKRMSDGEFNSLDDIGRKALFAKRDKLLKEAKAEETPPYKSSHWDEPNPIAHVRINDRIVDGNKTLHIEEIQSDLHQTGRDKGYKGEYEKLQPEFEKIEDKIVKSGNEEVMSQPDIQDALDLAVKNNIITKDEAKTYKRAVDIENYTDQAVPDFPFKKNWDEVLIKRMLHKAAKEGDDAISWTPGEAQALRYQNEIRQKLNNVDWHNRTMGKINPDGDKQILVETSKGNEIELTVNKKGKIIKGHAELKGKNLDSVLGKDIAKQILEKSEGSIDAKGYVMNSEAMKTYYDKMLVDKVNAIAKKYGGKVESKEIINPKEYEAWKELNRGQSSEVGDKSLAFNKIHYLKLTPELKKKALEGFPLFSQTPILNPVDFNPFEDKKPYRLTPVEGNPFQ